MTALAIALGWAAAFVFGVFIGLLLAARGLAIQIHNARVRQEAQS